MSCIAAARSVARAAGRTASVSRLAAGCKPSCSTRTLLPRPIPMSPRSAVEMSRSLSSMLPFHTATASSLLVSMISLSSPAFPPTIDDC